MHSLDSSRHLTVIPAVKIKQSKTARRTSTVLVILPHHTHDISPSIMTNSYRHTPKISQIFQCDASCENTVHNTDSLYALSWPFTRQQNASLQAWVSGSMTLQSNESLDLRGYHKKHLVFMNCHTFPWAIKWSTIVAESRLHERDNLSACARTIVTTERASEPQVHENCVYLSSSPK